MKRILFFVHYNQTDSLAEYVIYLLQHIKHIYTRVVFISNSFISESDLQKINGLYDDIIFRENKGFDFGAWKDALLKEKWDNLLQYDNVTLMNDTCFGPLFDLEDIYTKMEKQNIDFWGITLFKRRKENLFRIKNTTPEHIQSYFMCFNNEIVSSITFQKFWNNLKYLNNVKQVILKYETKLTSLLSKSGFKYTTPYNQEKTINNIAYNHPYLILQNNLPFLKIKSFVSFYYQKYIIKLVEEKTNYPVDLIYHHITDISHPNLSTQVINKQLSNTPLLTKHTSNIQIAIHLHVVCFNIFLKILDYFKNISNVFDIYITTDTINMKEQINKHIEITGIENQVKKNIVIENNEGNISSWLKISNLLNKYDIVGHFHTKISSSGEKWMGGSWFEEIFDLLLTPFDKIINEFNLYPKLGIVIPEIPIARQICPHLQEDRNNHKYFSKSLNIIWKRLNLKKNIDFKTLKTFIFPYGSMFFYRPVALKSLFQLSFTSRDFPSGPMKNDLTLAHCIERLPVYIAWGNNYDYRIMTYYPPKTNSFDNQERLSKLFIDFQNKLTYRIGHFILIIPKTIRKLINKK